jgi:outer membrane protein OmpA-like peptidoglycan-associated protein
MAKFLSGKRLFIGIVSLMLMAAIPNVSAQTVQLKGLIKGRSGPTIILETSDAETLTVTLTDSTEVGQVQGLFKARRKEMSMAALIPGLAVEIEATRDEHNQLVAKSVKFKGDDLKTAKSIQAGLHETSTQTQRNAEEVKKNQEDLDKQKAALQAQNDALQKQQQQVSAQQQKIAENQQKIAQNQAAIDAAIARFGQLDDYYILEEVTVYFGNGKTNLESKYQAPLLQLAQKAKAIQGYMIEVKGYASSVGSEAVNERFSEDRADNVANFLMRQGHISLTNMLAPAAMGESDQVGKSETAEGQAQNRRVVVRILQNKGVAGLQAKAD